MKKLFKVLGLSTAMLLTTVAPTFASNINGNNVIDVVGADRVETSVKAANYVNSDKLVVTDGYAFPDALSAMNVVNKTGAKFILVTNKTDIYSMFKNQNIKEVHIIGGKVSKNVIDGIKKLSKNVHYYNGRDRYETNELTLSAFNYKAVGVADGRNYPDALASAPLLKQKGYGLKLVNGAKPYTSKSTVKYTFGGSNAVKQNGGTRLSGKNRYATNIAINKQLTNITDTVMVSGKDFPDALSAINLVNNKMSLALVEKSNPLMKEYLKNIKNYYRLGGVVTEEIMKSLLPIKSNETVYKSVKFVLDDAGMVDEHSHVYAMAMTYLPKDISKHDISKPVTLNNNIPNIESAGGTWKFVKWDKIERDDSITYFMRWTFVKDVNPIIKKDVHYILSAVGMPDNIRNQILDEMPKDIIGHDMSKPIPEVSFKNEIIAADNGTWRFKKVSKYENQTSVRITAVWAFTKDNGDPEPEVPEERILTASELVEIRNFYNDYVNEYRKQIGVQPLKINNNLLAGVNIRAKELSIKFSNIRPDGTEFKTAFNLDESNIVGMGENARSLTIGIYGNKTTREIAETLAENLLNANSIDSNLLKQEYSEHNIGFYQGSDKKLYTSNVFISYK